MIHPDFSSYSLALVKDGEIIHNSTSSRLKPLVLCVNQFVGTVENGTLYDKVIGLAAARVIVFSKMISEVNTPLCSIAAQKHLEDNNITIIAEKVVPNILNNDQSDICPMEKIALSFIADDIEFYKHLKKLMLIN